MWAVLSLLAALAIGARAVYPRVIERRAARRRTLGPDGIIVGACEIERHRAGAPGVLLLHGGGDTPQVLAELAEHLHDRGFSVRAPLLTAHGRALSALRNASAADWHDDVRREFENMRARHDWVAIVALSMGGALAVKLASERRDIPAMVLLAPYVAMPAALRRLAATSAMWGVFLPYFTSLGARSIHDPSAAERTLGHGVFTPAALRALYGVVTEGERALPRVSTPTLVIQSKQDNRIAVASAESAFERLGSAEKRFVWVEGAGHVITVDYGRERVFELTCEWLQAHRSASRRGQ